MLIYHSFHSRLCGPHSDGEKSVGYLYFGRFFIFDYSSIGLMDYKYIYGTTKETVGAAVSDFGLPWDFIC